MALGSAPRPFATAERVLTPTQTLSHIPWPCQVSRRLRGAAVCRAWRHALAQGSLRSLTLGLKDYPRKLEWAARAGPAARVVYADSGGFIGGPIDYMDYMAKLRPALASVKVCLLSCACALCGTCVLYKHLMAPCAC